MTIHARGYRPYEGARRRFGLRFVPIFREGYRDANRGAIRTILRLIVLILFVVLSFSLYFQGGPLKDVFRMLPNTPRGEAEAARRALVVTIFLYQQWTALLVTLIAIFAGAGLVADDLRTRALPLYLVRPLTPFDYFLGKWLVPAAVIAFHVLLPGLLLVLFAAFLRPSGEALPFLRDQADVVKTLLVHFAVLATGYSSLILIVSTCARRRLTAIVLSALAFIGSGLVGGAGMLVPGTIGEAARACSLYSDALAVLRDGLGRELPPLEPRALPSVEAALAVPAALFVACAILVLRRARTSEVVS